jgi:predicted TIM-barrel fold metal-dependent hydrolase
LVIDAHIHAGHWSPGRFFGRGVDLGEIEECLEKCGIDGAVLTATDLRDNELVREFVRRARVKRLWFFPWINPAEPGQIEYLKGPAALDIDGLKFHPSCDRVRITDERVEPFLEIAGDRSLPVLVHCGRWQEMSSYSYALDAASRHAAVRFILSHMGGDTAELVLATLDGIRSAGLANVFLGMEGVREYWAIQRVIDELGGDRVIFGSDYPLGHPKMYLGLVEALRLSGRDRSLVLGGNILRLLGEAE